MLLEALAGLAQRRWTLHCVGSPQRDPALARQLHALTAAGPLAGRVVWHGEVDEAALQARYAAADVFVLASLHEGHGMVIDEALRHGLPVVASDAGALAQTLPPGAGLHVPAGNVTAWRQTLDRVMEDAALRQALVTGAQSAAAALPTWARQAGRWARVLQRVMQAPSAPAEGFSADWLSLREPFDTAARDRAAGDLQLLPAGQQTEIRRCDIRLDGQLQRTLREYGCVETGKRSGTARGIRAEHLGDGVRPSGARAGVAGVLGPGQ